MNGKKRERIRDALAVVGSAAIAIGLWWAWPPLAWVGIGVVLIGGALLWSKIEKKGEPE